LFYLIGYGIDAQNTAYFFQLFADNGIHIYAFARRGFGGSEGKKGDVAGEALYPDHWRFIELALAHGNYSPDVPKFIFGCSYGGLNGARLIQ